MVAARAQVDALNVVLLGPPGAGKGTQAGPLCRALGLSYLAAGDLLRGHRERRTPLGREVARFMAEGQLVPDELVITMILEQLEGDRHGLVLDGFPRTLAQAEALSDAVDITAALLIDAPDDTIVERIAGRRRCPDGHRRSHDLRSARTERDLRPRRPALGAPRRRRAGNRARATAGLPRAHRAGRRLLRALRPAAVRGRHAPHAEVQRELLTSLRRFAGTRTWRL